MKYLLSVLLVFSFVGCDYATPEDEQILTQNGTISAPYIIEEYSENNVFNLKSGVSYFKLQNLSNDCYVNFETDYDRLDTIDYNSTLITLYDYYIIDSFVNITLLTKSYNTANIQVKLFNNALASVTVDCRDN